MNDIAVGMAQDVNTPPDVLHILALPNDTNVRVWVAWNPSTMSKTLDFVVRGSSNARIQLAVAQHANTTSETLHWLAGNGFAECLKLVAKHPNTTHDTLHILSQSRWEDVRLAAAKNPNLRLDDLHVVLERDARKYGHNTLDPLFRRLKPLYDRSTPPEVLHQHAMTVNHPVLCEQIIHNPSTPFDTLAQMLNRVGLAPHIYTAIHLQIERLGLLELLA